MTTPPRAPVATGLSRGAQTDPKLAATAVTTALARADAPHANSVLLFLTPHFAQNPEPALRAAARAAGCTQVVGCTGAGILTEDEWVLDSPGAAAMIFAGDLRLTPPRNLLDEPVLLSLCTPANLAADWLDVPTPRIGAISGDLAGQGPFKVWSGSRVVDNGRVEVMVAGARAAVQASQGVRALTSPIEVAEVQGYDVLRLGNYPALNVLVKSLPSGVREMERIPLHLIMGGVTFGDPTTAIREGRYRLNHIVAANLNEQSITLSHPLNRGERLFWAMRDTLAAERDMRMAMERAAEQLADTPDFGFLFPCMGRGPHFYGNTDRDLELMRARFAGLPLIGMYGNGEIGPLDEGNHLYQYSAIVGLFKAQTTA